MQKGCACKFLHGPETTDEHKGQIDKALESKNELKLEVIFYKKDGELFSALWTYKGDLTTGTMAQWHNRIGTAQKQKAILLADQTSSAIFLWSFLGCISNILECK